MKKWESPNIELITFVETENNSEYCQYCGAPLKSNNTNWGQHKKVCAAYKNNNFPNPIVPNEMLGGMPTS